MRPFAAALKELLRLRRSTQPRRRRTRQLCNLIETLESRVLLSAITAAAEPRSAEVEVCAPVELRIEFDQSEAESCPKLVTTAEGRKREHRSRHLEHDARHVDHGVRRDPRRQIDSFGISPSTKRIPIERS